MPPRPQGLLSPEQQAQVYAAQMQALQGLQQHLHGMVSSGQVSPDQHGFLTQFLAGGLSQDQLWQLGTQVRGAMCDL